MQDVIELTRSLVDIASVTGEEAALGNFLFELLSGWGWECVRQPVCEERFNLLATRGDPTVLLTTHLDTVPPFFPSREDDLFVYGRGCCDAKGIAAAMICAAGELWEAGAAQPGLLFVVGEEVDSVGAVKATELQLHCEFVIDGEPTDNVLVRAHKGIVYARIRAAGKAVHSAYPERGQSANHLLVEVLHDLSSASFPSDQNLGPSLLNIGWMQGGIAPNVLSDRAEAEILLRTVTESRNYVRELEAVIAGRAQCQILKTTEPQEMYAPPGLPSKVVGFGTDIPALRELGVPLLLGPGSVFEAHTAGEKISKQELREAVSLYKDLVRRLEEQGQTG